MVVSAPGRVNLIGEHTDYNGGQVLPLAIGLRTWVAARLEPRQSESAVVSSAGPPESRFDINAPLRAGDWGDYVRGVAWAMKASSDDARPVMPQVSMAIHSDVPTGAGLSSSAALEVAVSLALMELLALRHESRGLAMTAWRAETEFVGVPCGVMDQFASALGRAGHAVHIRCDTLETSEVPFDGTVLVFDTAVPRSLRVSAFELRRQECERALALLREEDPGLDFLAHATAEHIRDARLPSPLAARAAHVVNETRRVERSVAELRRSRELSGEVLNASHESLRDLYECSSPELDWVHARANTMEGVSGARLTGAGWGGCAIAVGDRDALALAATVLPAEYEARFGRRAQTWLSHAAPGARVERESERQN